MRRRTSYLTVAAVLATVGIVVAAGGGDSVARKARETRETRFAWRPRAFAALATTAPVLEIGVEHAYEVSLSQTARHEAAAQPELTVSLDGTWAVSYAGSDARGLVFRAQLRDAKPIARRGGADVSAGFTAGLSRPYYFATTAAGRLSTLYFAADVDGVARGTLGALAATFQRSHGSQDTSWNTVETDSIGDYRARYVRDGHSVHRERLAYDRVAGGHTIAASVVTTGTDFALRDDGWPDGVTGTEATRLGTKDVGVVVDARFAMHHRGVAQIDAGWPNDLQVVAVDVATAAAGAAAQADRDLVDGATLPDLLAELARLGAADTQARGYLFLRIAALFRLDAGAARAAARSVLDHTAGAATPVVIGALGEAGTPQAQAGLGQVLAAPALDAESRSRAAIALGLTADPTVDTLDALAQEATRDDADVSATATLAEGTAVLHLRGSDGDAAGRQIDALLARFAAATDDDERALVLRALGNTGDLRILPAVQQGLASADPMVRVAATEALRLVPGDAIDALLLASLRDPYGLVRAAAVFATGERSLVPYAATFDRTERGDRDVTVRRAVVELAGARFTELPALRAIVAYAADRDPDPELRETAKQLLATPNSTP